LRTDRFVSHWYSGSNKTNARVAGELLLPTPTVLSAAMLRYVRGATAAASGAFLLSCVVLYGDVLMKLVRDWATDDNYSHGFVVAPLAGYFAWRRRSALAAAPLRPSRWGLVLVGVSVVMLFAGALGAELFVSRTSLLILVAGALLYLLGPAHLRILAFPVAFLALMIPLPAIIFNQIALPLQLFASRVGALALTTAGVPVLREGNVITLANTTLEVAEACSGIRSLVSLVTLAIVLGQFAESRRWIRQVLVAAAIPVAIAANAARVAGTGLAAHYIGPAAADGFFHAFSGWFMFLMALALLLATQRLLDAIASRPRIDRSRAVEAL
jgi:exosortase